MRRKLLSSPLVKGERSLSQRTLNSLHETHHSLSQLPIFLYKLEAGVKLGSKRGCFVGSYFAVDAVCGPAMAVVESKAIWLPILGQWKMFHSACCDRNF